MSKETNSQQFGETAVSGNRDVGPVPSGQMHLAPAVAEVFHPAPKNVSHDVYVTLRREMLRHFSRQMPGGCVNNNRFFVSEQAEDMLMRAGGVIGALADVSQAIRIPNTSPERTAFAYSLIDRAVEVQQRQFRIIAPVCPDYGKGTFFYKNIQGGISPEAQGAINASKVIGDILPRFGYGYTMDILVADTEDDKPDIIACCAGGSVGRYKQACEDSVVAIQEQIDPDQPIRVMTFTQALGDAFRKRQYAYEDYIRFVMQENRALLAEVEGVTQARLDRYKQILGRREQDYELTVRYMAQYAALGSLVRQLQQPAVFVNYETPNRAYFNAGFYKGLALVEEDKIIIPVLGSVVKRE